MTQMILFDGDYYNPDLIWKVSRVTNTVTLAIVQVGMGAGTNYTEDHIFGSEAEAIVALNDFIAEINAININELICCVSSGVISNSSLTDTFERSGGSSEGGKTRTQRDLAYAVFIVRMANVIKGLADAT